MESKDKLKEIDIKNRTCYYFVDIIKVEDIYSGDNLLDEKSYENILIYDISYKAFMGEKPLRIWFDKIDEFIKIDNGIRYLVLDHSRFDKICDIIKYLLVKKEVLQIVLINFARIRIDSYNYLPIEKKLNVPNVMILIKSVVNKDKSNYHYNIFLEKGLYNV